MNILCGSLFVHFLIFCLTEGCGGLPVSRLIPAATATPPRCPLALVTCSNAPFGGPHLRFGLAEAGLAEGCVLPMAASARGRAPVSGWGQVVGSKNEEATRAREAPSSSLVCGAGRGTPY